MLLFCGKMEQVVVHRIAIFSLTLTTIEMKKGEWIEVRRHHHALQLYVQETELYGRNLANAQAIVIVLTFFCLI